MSYVYFIQSECGKVKIGLARSPQSRLTIFRVGSPVSLALVACIPGDRDAEQKMHKRFKKYRLRGEWFSMCPALAKLISRNAWEKPSSQAMMIGGMTPETDLFFKGASPNSIKAIASRLSNGSRRYATARQNGGVRVWRLK